MMCKCSAVLAPTAIAAIVWAAAAAPNPAAAKPPVGYPALAPANLSVQPAPSLASGSVPAALAAALDPQGERVISGGNALCDIWLLKSVPVVKSSAASPDIVYGGLQVGTLVGVIQILAPAQDFRHQKLPPGLYTLRYGQIPQDGNHMGASQYRDFLLLGPAAADPQVDKPLAFDDLVALSRKTAGTGHPAVMSLIPANSNVKTLPGTFSDDAGDAVLQFSLHEQSAGSTEATPVALVIVPGAQSGEQ
jgi:hypothetical protein